MWNIVIASEGEGIQAVGCISGLLRRGACHRAALRADPLAPRNDERLISNVRLSPLRRLISWRQRQPAADREELHAVALNDKAPDAERRLQHDDDGEHAHAD